MATNIVADVTGCCRDPRPKWRRHAFTSALSRVSTRWSGVVMPSRSPQGSVLRRFNRCGTVSSVHRSALAPSSRHSNGIETMAPGRARGENAQTDVLVRLFRR
jgi:hypothetical protein